MVMAWAESGTEEGYLTPDGNHRFQPTAEEQAPAAGRFLRAFFLDQPKRYQQLLWSSIWELSSEMEQQAHHWRQSRLDEKGFPGLDDALEIYAPPTRSQSIPQAPTPTDPDALPAPRLPVIATSHSPVFTGALELLQDEHRDDLLHGFRLRCQPSTGRRLRRYRRSSGSSEGRRESGRIRSNRSAASWRYYPRAGRHNPSRDTGQGVVSRGL